MRVSFLELYNEELFDLLSPSDDNTKLRIFEDSARKVLVIKLWYADCMYVCVVTNNGIVSFVSSCDGMPCTQTFHLESSSRQNKVIACYSKGERHELPCKHNSVWVFFKEGECSPPQTKPWRHVCMTSIGVSRRLTG